MCVSCSEDIDSKINGQWQLKSIEEKGEIFPVDTVFYNFQRGTIFSFTILIPNSSIESITSSGYIYFPSEDQLLISMDTTRHENGVYKNINGDFLKHSGWSDYFNYFEITDINNKHMTLSDNKKTYFFKKY